MWVGPEELACSIHLYPIRHLTLPFANHYNVELTHGSIIHNTRIQILSLFLFSLLYIFKQTIRFDVNLRQCNFSIKIQNNCFKSFYLSFTKYSGCTFHQLLLLFLFIFYTLHWWFTFYFRWYTVEIHTVVQTFKVIVLKISVYLTTGLLKFLSFLTQKIITKGTKAQEKTKSIKNMCKNTSNISIKFYLYCFQYDTYVHWQYASWKHIFL